MSSRALFEVHSTEFARQKRFGKAEKIKTAECNEDVENNASFLYFLWYFLLISFARNKRNKRKYIIIYLNNKKKTMYCNGTSAK